MTKAKTAPPKAPLAPKAAKPTPTAASAPAVKSTTDAAADKPIDSTPLNGEDKVTEGLKSPAGPLSFPDPANQLVTRLEHARSLAEVAAYVKSKPASDKLTAIQSFKGEDRRTMTVVLVDGALAQQEVVS